MHEAGLVITAARESVSWRENKHRISSNSSTPDSLINVIRKHHAEKLQQQRPHCAWQNQYMEIHTQINIHRLNFHDSSMIKSVSFGIRCLKSDSLNYTPSK